MRYGVNRFVVVFVDQLKLISNGAALSCERFFFAIVLLTSQASGLFQRFPRFLSRLSSKAWGALDIEFHK
jgi:hypothetical protein